MLISVMFNGIILKLVDPKVITAEEWLGDQLLSVYKKPTTARLTNNL